MRNTKLHKGSYTHWHRVTERVLLEALLVVVLIGGGLADEQVGGRLVRLSQPTPEEQGGGGTLAVVHAWVAPSYGAKVEGTEPALASCTIRPEQICVGLALTGCDRADFAAWKHAICARLEGGPSKTEIDFQGASGRILCKKTTDCVWVLDALRFCGQLRVAFPITDGSVPSGEGGAGGIGAPEPAEWTAHVDRLIAAYAPNRLGSARSTSEGDYEVVCRRKTYGRRSRDDFVCVLTHPAEGLLWVGPDFAAWTWTTVGWTGLGQIEGQPGENATRWLAEYRRICPPSTPAVILDGEWIGNLLLLGGRVRLLPVARRTPLEPHPEARLRRILASRVPGRPHLAFIVERSADGSLLAAFAPPAADGLKASIAAVSDDEVRDAESFTISRGGRTPLARPAEGELIDHVLAAAGWKDGHPPTEPALPMLPSADGASGLVRLGAVLAAAQSTSPRERLWLAKTIGHETLRGSGTLADLAAYVLADLTTSDVDTTLTALEAANAEECRPLAHALSRVEGLSQGCRSRMLFVIDNGAPKVALATMEAYAQVTGCETDIVPRLVRLLESRSSSVRMSAVFTAGQIRVSDARALGILESQLAAEGPLRTRYRMAAALARCGHAGAQANELLEALRAAGTSDPDRWLLNWAGEK